jgi:hypothetical protein
MTLTDQSCIHEEIKSRLNSGNAYYHAVQNGLSSCVQKYYLSAVLYGYETWFLMLRGEQIEGV